ncbi:MAG: hypothetical protein RSB41_02510, partial [Bacilli bacterium]
MNNEQKFIKFQNKSAIIAPVGEDIILSLPKTFMNEDNKITWKEETKLFCFSRRNPESIRLYQEFIKITEKISQADDAYIKDLKIVLVSSIAGIIIPFLSTLLFQKDSENIRILLGINALPICLISLAIYNCISSKK